MIVFQSLHVGDQFANGRLVADLHKLYDSSCVFLVRLVGARFQRLRAVLLRLRTHRRRAESWMLSYEDRVQQCRLTTLETRSVRGDQIDVLMLTQTARMLSVITGAEPEPGVGGSFTFGRGRCWSIRAKQQERGPAPGFSLKPRCSQRASSIIILNIQPTQHVSVTLNTRKVNFFTIKKYIVGCMGVLDSTRET